MIIDGSLSLHAMQQLQAPFTAHVGVLHNSVSWDCQTEWNLFIQTLPDVRVSFHFLFLRLPLS